MSHLLCIFKLISKQKDYLYLTKKIIYFGLYHFYYYLILFIISVLILIFVDIFLCIFPFIFHEGFIIKIFVNILNVLPLHDKFYYEYIIIYEIYILTKKNRKKTYSILCYSFRIILNNYILLASIAVKLLFRLLNIYY